jgi:hypothetical protein
MTEGKYPSDDMSDDKFARYLAQVTEDAQRRNLMLTAMLTRRRYICASGPIKPSLHGHALEDIERNLNQQPDVSL